MIIESRIRDVQMSDRQILEVVLSIRKDLAGDLPEDVRDVLESVLALLLDVRA